jgi:hypothetical protein
MRTVHETSSAPSRDSYLHGPIVLFCPAYAMKRSRAGSIQFAD